MAAYSFQDCAASITGPGGSFQLGSGSGNAEEGITVAMVEAKNTMTIGADGSVMHSLHAGKGGTLTLTLLKTSPVNAQLSELYNFQTKSSATHGQNTITIRDIARGDTITSQLCAFQKHPDVTYAKEGGTMQWIFDAGVVDHMIGTGTPDKLA